MKGFYLDTATNNWTIIHDNGGIEVVSAGTCNIYVTADQLTVYINQGSERKGMALITALSKDSIGTKYASYADFKTATANFTNNTGTFNTEQF
jgi:hypothetical protein